MPKDTFFNLPDDKRQMIIDLAIEEFAANNYKQASISRIVKRAGIAKGSFYQYFENKKDLYLYLLYLAGEEKQAFFAANPPPDPQMGVFDYLRYLAEIGVYFQFANPQLNELGYRAIFSDAPFLEEVRQQMAEGSKRFFSGLLAQGIEQGQIDPALDLELASFILAAVFDELGNYIIRRLEIDPAELLEDGIDVLKRDPAAFEEIYAGVLGILKDGMKRKDEK